MVDGVCDDSGSSRKPGFEGGRILFYKDQRKNVYSVQLLGFASEPRELAPGEDRKRWQGVVCAETEMLVGRRSVSWPAIVGSNVILWQAEREPEELGRSRFDKATETKRVQWRFTRFEMRRVARAVPGSSIFDFSWSLFPLRGSLLFVTGSRQAMQFVHAVLRYQRFADLGEGGGDTRVMGVSARM